MKILYFLFVIEVENWKIQDFSNPHPSQETVFNLSKNRFIFYVLNIVR